MPDRNSSCASLRAPAHGWYLPMSVGRRRGRLDVWVLACALASGCDAPSGSAKSGNPPREFREQQIESALSAAEPRRLSEPAGSLLTVAFRSRQPAQTFADPEVSLGTPVESVASDDHAGAAPSKSMDWANLDSDTEPGLAESHDELVPAGPSLTGPAGAPPQPPAHDSARLSVCRGLPTAGARRRWTRWLAGPMRSCGKASAWPSAGRCFRRGGIFLRHWE